MIRVLLIEHSLKQKNTRGMAFQKLTSNTINTKKREASIGILNILTEE